MEEKIIERTRFHIVGKKTWITGQENEQFGRFWKACREQGLFQKFELLRDRMNLPAAGEQTGSTLLGVSCIQGDPSLRAFFYWVAMEVVEGMDQEQIRQIGLDTTEIPAGIWAVFPCRGPIPKSIMKAEMYAFEEWLPQAPYIHAGTFEMEVYLPDDGEEYCEFWMPIRRKIDHQQSDLRRNLRGTISNCST